jgi:hypothetical protein
MHSTSKHKWPTLTEIATLQKSQLFIEFPFICPHNLKFVDGRESNLSLKILILPPLGLC